MNVKNLSNIFAGKIKVYNSDISSPTTVSLADIMNGAIDIAQKRNCTDEFVKSTRENYHRFQEANRAYFIEHLPEINKPAVKKFMELPEYGDFLLPFMADKKPGELEYLYKIASKTDAGGQIRIPSVTFPYFSEIPMERLKVLRPIIDSKNADGLWNFAPSYILSLDRFNDRQLEIMSKLAGCSVNGRCMQIIAANPHINQNRTVEIAQTLKNLYGKNLKEISFFSKDKENFFTADIQVPALYNKTATPNVKTLLVKLDNEFSPSDSIRLQPDTVNLIEKIYRNLYDNACVFSRMDLEKAVFNVQKNLPEFDRENILSVMQRLTQFANYSSLPAAAEKLAAEKIKNIYTYGGELNPVFEYFFAKKKLFSLDSSPDSFRAYFLTKNDVNNPEHMANLKKKLSDANFKQSVKFVNLEGFSDSVNFLSDDTLLAQKTVEVLRKAKKIMLKHSALTLDEAISIVFNHKIEKTAKNLGIDILNVRLDAPGSPSVILEQMSPIMPTKELFQSCIETVANHYANTKQELHNISYNLIRYFEGMQNIFTKQRIIEDLKELNKLINTYIKDNNISAENLYYIKPHNPFTVKSYDLISKMYKNLFDIPTHKLLEVEDISELKNYPENSVFVFLDDYIGTGESMVNIGKYEQNAGKFKENVHILFAPVAAAKDGINYVNSVIRCYARGHFDAVICLDKNIKDFDNFKYTFLHSNFKQTFAGKKILGNEGFERGSQCTAFPYMTPDNNAALAANFTSFFLPNNDCIKTNSVLLPEIKEKAFYRNIFGNDKENILY